MRNLALAKIDGLSARAVNCCNDVGIATIGDLFDFIKNKSLSTIKNCGNKTARELNQIIAQYEGKVAGYKYNLFALETEVQEAEEPAAGFQTTECGKELDGTDLLVSLNEGYAECLDESEDALAGKIRAKYPNIESILLMVSQQPEGLLDRYEDWTIEDHFRFWTFCEELLSDMIAAIDKDRYPSLYKSLSSAHDYLRTHIKDRKISLIRARIREIARSN